MSLSSQTIENETKNDDYIEVQYLGMTRDSKNKILLIDDKRYHYKKVKQLTIPGAIYSVKAKNTETGMSIWFDTTQYLRMGELNDSDITNHAAAKKVITMKKFENKMKKEQDNVFGELTLNQIRDQSYHFSKSEKAALLASILTHVGA